MFETLSNIETDRTIYEVKTTGRPRTIEKVRESQGNSEKIKKLENAR